MKFLYTLAFLMTFSVIVSAQAIPDINVKTLNGETVRLLDYAENDKPTIISFWATWCTPCKKELDAINDIYPDWVEDYGVELLAITVDDARQLAKVKPLVAQKGWEYTILSDMNKQSMQMMGFQTIPQTYLLDKSGNIVYTHSGYAPGDEYELEDQLKKL
ncbi:MAG: TlpA disulfide reductase family protein [Saprospiraceae bacterium]|nr:TlpA disulfide reductase family protein [Saprospiraceae bacterium]